MTVLRWKIPVLLIGFLALAMVATAQAQAPPEEPGEAAEPAAEPTSGYRAAGPAAGPQPAKVIMFATLPPAEEAAFPGDETMAGDIGNRLRGYLTSVRGMSVATVHPASPMIKNSPNLVPEDVAPMEGETPKARAERALNVVRELGVDYALVPAIVQYKFDATKPQATVTLNVYRVKTEGELAAIVVSGRSPDRPPRQADEQVLARAAVADAALRAAAQILEVSADDLQRWIKMKHSGKSHRRFLIF